MKFRILFMAAFVLLLNFIPALSSNITVFNFTKNTIQINWKLAELQRDEHKKGNKLYTYIQIDNASYFDHPGKPDIPFREFLLGIPDGAKISYSIEILESEIISDILDIAFELLQYLFTH